MKDILNIASERDEKKMKSVVVIHSQSTFNTSQHSLLMCLTLAIQLNKFICSLKIQTRISSPSWIQFHKMELCMYWCVCMNGWCFLWSGSNTTNCRTNAYTDICIAGEREKETDTQFKLSCIKWSLWCVRVSRQRHSTYAWSKSVYFNCLPLLFLLC